MGARWREVTVGLYHYILMTPCMLERGLIFLHNSSVNNQLSKWSVIFVVFYYRAERPLKSTVEKSTTSEDMVLKANLAGLEKIRSPYHLYLFRPERALFTSRMSPQHLKVNLASLEKIQSPYHPYLFRPERALFTSRINPRVLASSRNVVSVESSSLV
jgi:hypothetical protein